MLVYHHYLEGRWKIKQRAMHVREGNKAKIIIQEKRTHIEKNNTF